MALKPTNKTVFVRITKPQKMGTIEIASNYDKFSGEVVASDSALCKPGDRVLFHKARTFAYAEKGTEQAIEVVTVNEADIVGVDTDPAPAVTATTTPGVQLVRNPLHIPGHN